MPTYRPRNASYSVIDSKTIVQEQTMSYSYIPPRARLTSVSIMDINAASININFAVFPDGDDLTRVIEVDTIVESVTVSDIVSALNNALGGDYAQARYDRVILNSIDKSNNYSCIYIFNEQPLYQDGPRLFSSMNPFMNANYLVPNIVGNNAEVLCANIDPGLEDETVFVIDSSTDLLLMSVDGVKYFPIVLPHGNLTPDQLSAGINNIITSNRYPFETRSVQIGTNDTTTVKIISKGTKLYISPRSTCLAVLGLPSSYASPVCVCSGPPDLQMLSPLPAFPGFLVDDVVVNNVNQYSFMINPRGRERMVLNVVALQTFNTVTYLYANEISADSLIGVIRNPGDILTYHGVCDSKLYSVIATTLTSESTITGLRFILTGEFVDFMRG